MKCTLPHSCNNTAATYGNLIILLFFFTVPVQIIVAPMNENLTSSNTTIIWKCIAVGYHHPTITWSRNGAELVPERSTSTMFVKGGVAFIQSTFEVCVDDTAIGVYKCIVSNAYTTTSSTFTLHTDGRSSCVLVTTL